MGLFSKKREGGGGLIVSRRV